jgi:hypothetical protein
MLVAERAFQHQELFAAAMDVSGELRAGVVADDAGRAGDFVADAVQSVAVHAGFG